MTERPWLQRLADAAGIESSYVDNDGQTRSISDPARESLLAAMGIEAASEATAATALTALVRDRDASLVSPVEVVEEDLAEDRATLRLRLDTPLEGAVPWRLTVRTEDGRRLDDEGVAQGSGQDLTWKSTLLSDLPLGVHQVTAVLRPDGPSALRSAVQHRIVAPRLAFAPRRRCLGLQTQLYGLRRDRDWGVGDLTSLAELARWAGRLGAQFVGINPLHALDLTGRSFSPYAPWSRTFDHVLYIDVEAVPELRRCEPARERLASSDLTAELGRLRARDRVDYPAVLRCKLELLGLLFAALVATPGSKRYRQYAAWVKAEGKPLQDYATFAALALHRGTDDWRQWPPELGRPDTTAIASFRQEHPAAIGLHCFVQFELDRQLGAAAEVAAEVGLGHGLFADLAVGSAPGGSDTWSEPELYARGATLGAPPDAFTAAGQDWGLWPLIPAGSRRTGHRFFRRLLAHTLRHAGVVRIDHVIGLNRMYWVPAGLGARDGAYVRYPERELLALVALESVRNDAVVVGEDLGTVPHGMRERLVERGLLRCHVMVFERGESGRFQDPHAYTRDAIATANTHDLPTLGGMWEGADLRERRALGVIPSDDELAAAEAERQALRVALVDLLRRHGHLPQDAWPESTSVLCRAVYAYLASTPSTLVGVAVDDLAGELAAVNLPGVVDERNWSRRMGRSIEQLRQDRELNAWLEALARR